MDVDLDPIVNMEYLLAYIRRGEALTTFVVLSLPGEEYGLRFSVHGHNMMCKRLRVHYEECLINDGNFKINPSSGNLEFRYLLPETHDKKVEEAAENKIQAFLRSHGINFRRVVYPKD